MSRRRSSRISPARCPKTGKRVLRTETDAKIVLAELQWRDKGQQRYYRCEFCRKYHLTSQPQRAVARI